MYRNGLNCASLVAHNILRGTLDVETVTSLGNEKNTFTRQEMLINKTRRLLAVRRKDMVDLTE